MEKWREEQRKKKERQGRKRTLVVSNRAKI